MNGVLHLSIGDGWWAEGYTGHERLADRRRRRRRATTTPWTPPTPRRSTACSKSEVVPAFYDRDARGIPRRWLAMVKQAILTVTPRFSRAAHGQGLRRARVRAGVHDDRADGCRHAARRTVDAIAPYNRPTRWPRQVRAEVRRACALCGAKEVSEPRGEERYCRDCWDKKIAVEDIVAREFALKRYIRAHSAEKYLVYHSTQKRPVGQLHRRRRRLRSVPDAAALSDLRLGRRRPTTSRTTPSTARSPRSSSTSSPPRSSSRGAAASGTWKSSDRPRRSRRTGTARL